MNSNSIFTKIQFIRRFFLTAAMGILALSWGDFAKAALVFDVGRTLDFGQVSTARDGKGSEDKK